ARIANLAHGTVIVIVFRRSAKTHFFDVDRHAKVHPNLADRHSQRIERVIGVGTSVTYHDEATAPQHHFVEPKILEVTAIRKINIGTLSVSHAERLCHNGTHRLRGRSSIKGWFAAVASQARIAEPK